MVTGAGGFLGNAIAQSLVALGHRVIACVSPATALSRTTATRVCRFHFPDSKFNRLVAMEQPAWLIHCAGSASVAASIRDPLQDWQTNVAGTASVYDAFDRYSPETRIVFLSSAAVYGQPQVFPITEETPVAPISPYGEHKLACEQLGIELNNRSGIEVTNLRIFSAYGAGLEKQVLWDMYRKSMQSTTVTLEGDGTETRDLIYVSDIVRVVNRLVRSEQQVVKLLNVASGKSIDIANLAKQFFHALGIQRELCFTGHRSPGVPARWSIATNLLERLDMLPQITLNDGLAKYVDWLRYQEGGSDARRALAAAG